MKRSEFIKWKMLHGRELELGTMVKISPSCKYYESEYDQNQIYMVTCLYVDNGGLNICVNDDGRLENWTCDADGYRIGDLLPAK